MQERQRKGMEKRVASSSEYCVCGIEYYRARAVIRPSVMKGGEFPFVRGIKQTSLQVKNFSPRVFLRDTTRTHLHPHSKMQYRRMGSHQYFMPPTIFHMGGVTK